VQVPMFETMIPFVLGEHMAGATFDPPLGGPGYVRQLARERKPYATRDGYVCALIYNDNHWRSFFRIIGEPQRFDSDPRLADIGTRTRHIVELYAMVAEVMRTRSTAQWLELLERADIPATRLHTLDSLLEDPHLREVGFFPMVDHPSEGRIRTLAIPGTWSESQPSLRRPAPRLGEHSSEVLAEAGYSSSEIERLIALGVTRVAAPAQSA
jgi:crotonobetainyl-CoA:carnitine CoA-transferase CaiB-like acyl-CoA transferase